MTDDLDEIRTEFKKCKKYAIRYGRLEVLDELEICIDNCKENDYIDNDGYHYLKSRIASMREKK